MQLASAAAGHAVLGLAPPHRGDAAERDQVRREVGREARVVGRRLLQPAGGVLESALVHEQHADLGLEGGPRRVPAGPIGSRPIEAGELAEQDRTTPLGPVSDRRPQSLERGAVRNDRRQLAGKLVAAVIKEPVR